MRSLTVTIHCDGETFEGERFGLEMAHVLRVLASRVEYARPTSPQDSVITAYALESSGGERVGQATLIVSR